VAATGATELPSRFCDRPSPPATLLRVPPARPVLFSPSPLPPPSFALPRYPILHSTPSGRRVPRLHPRASTGINSETPEESLSTCRGSVGRTSFVSSPTERDPLALALASAGKICAPLVGVSSPLWIDRGEVVFRDGPNVDG